MVGPPSLHFFLQTVGLGEEARTNHSEHLDGHTSGEEGTWASGELEREASWLLGFVLMYHQRLDPGHSNPPTAFATATASSF